MSEFVTVFRALDGQRTSNNHSLFSGVSDADLQVSGITFDNRSAAQTMSRTHRYAFDRGMGPNPFRRVAGLPVFLYDSGPKYWLENKHFSRPPAIVIARIPVDLFTGSQPQIRLIKNDPNERHDITYPLESILQLARGEIQPKGEHFLQWAGESTRIPPNLIRQNEQFLRPTGFSSGLLRQDHPFTRVTLNR